ncbi:hypothetical protein CAN33_0017010 [Aspergillus niger]|uniref:Uncharacterized protein n=1 Tax=Aspergillus niger TaxID=5061 RepID=A0A505IG94_ASPNG|nr:hypothetical protein CAN33_0017010 [Aspergillus niger]
MVRSEANSLPFLFTAPQTTETPAATEQAQNDEELQQQEEVKDTTEPVPEGVVVDGVYFVPPTSTTNTTAAPAANVAEEAISDAQSSYYNLLHHRFLLLRSILKCTPPSEAIAGLDESHPISLPRHSRNARKEWRRLLLAVDPQTVQLACMDMESVLGVLEIMARLMSENVRSGDAQRVQRIGAWAWGLLGKCRDVGQLGTEEDHDMQDVEEEKPATEEELEAAKARLQAKLAGGEDQPTVTEPEAGNENPANEAATQTRAMLDMIITVIGEYYGQRDLLGARELWNGPEATA